MAKTNVVVELVGEDGNAFAIIGRVSQALKKNGYADLAKEFQKEAMSGDYDHLLRTAMEYVEVEDRDAELEDEEEEDEDEEFEEDEDGKYIVPDVE